MRNWSCQKRFARYLINKTRTVTRYEYQEEPTRITVYSDSEYAGCHNTRKPTSGGIAMFGKCAIKTWSSTQNVVALSSGEAEYYGLVKAASHGIGTRNLFNDLGHTRIEKVQVLTDASASMGMASRRATGKVRHIEVSQLWLQDKVMRNEVELVKIRADQNLADALTKYVDWEVLDKHMRHVNMRYESGRHSEMTAMADMDEDWGSNE